MSNAKKVKDVMVKITDYPHIPYWLSVRDAISMIHSTYGETPGTKELPTVFVFDEKYQLQGMLTVHNLLMGIEPRFLRKDEKSPYQGIDCDDPASLSVLAEGTFSEKCKEESRKPVSEVMTRIKAEVDANASVSKAAFIMLHAGVDLIPVMDGKKIAGVLRISDVFIELTGIVLD